jgi:small-conductance mechanosensitive channel
MIDWHSWVGLAVAVLIALAAVTLVIVVITTALRLAARRREWPKVLMSKARFPFRLLLGVVAVWSAVALTFPAEDWTPTVSHGFLIATIVALAWFVAALVSFALGATAAGYRIDVSDNLVARRRRTQLTIVQRLASAVIVILAIGAILLTFPGVQAVGASVLASAGVVSIVAGLAAQSTLANVFAGIQLAFSDAIRVDDVVIADGEWGRIEEITLTYVVVHIWDDRRMVLPSTYFTTTPFQNWTRHSSELLGSVEFDVDWRVSPNDMREELARVLARTTLWDGRTSVLQVTDATGSVIRIRILVTAKDAPTLFDLRCFVREQLVEWVHTKNAAALPVTRVQLVEDAPAPPTRSSGSEQPGLFTGSTEAEERAQLFTSSMPVVDPERENG